MVGFAAQCLIELGVEGLTGAGHGERSPERINHRNGDRDTVWEGGRSRPSRSPSTLAQVE